MPAKKKLRRLLDRVSGSLGRAPRRGNRSGQGEDPVDEERVAILERLASINSSIDRLISSIGTRFSSFAGWEELESLYAARKHFISQLEPGTLPGDLLARDGNDEFDRAMEAYLASKEPFYMGNLAEARNLLEDAVKLVPWNLPALVSLANVHLAGENHDMALEILEKALDLVEGQARSRILTNLGLVSLKNGRFEDANSFLHEALSLDPGNALALNNLGILNELVNRTSVAIEYYKRAIRAAPDDDELWYNLGNLAGKLGMKGERLFCFIKAEERGFVELSDMINDLLAQRIEPVDPFVSIPPVSIDPGEVVPGTAVLEGDGTRNVDDAGEGEGGRYGEGETEKEREGDGEGEEKKKGMDEGKEEGSGE